MMSGFGAAILMCFIIWIILLLIAAAIDCKRERRGKKGRKDRWY